MVSRNNVKLNCTCCKGDEDGSTLSQNQEKVELCFIKEASYMYQAEEYSRKQRDTLYEIRKIVQYVALLVCVGSFGLFVVTCVFRALVHRCCSRGYKCFEFCCCDNIIIDDPELDDQMLIDRLLTTRKLNQVHCNYVVNVE